MPNMDMTKITAEVEAAAEALTTGAAGPLPPVQMQTKTGKAGYDHLIDALNRLPRPLLALGTLVVFLVAGINPAWFEAQMQALNAMPQPLWWLLGAVLTMFFGSREAFYARQKTPPKA
jgi:hypothetical protein